MRRLPCGYERALVYFRKHGFVLNGNSLEKSIALNNGGTLVCQVYYDVISKPKCGSVNGHYWSSRYIFKGFEFGYNQLVIDCDSSSSVGRFIACCDKAFNEFNKSRWRDDREGYIKHKKDERRARRAKDGLSKLSIDILGEFHPNLLRFERSLRIRNGYQIVIDPYLNGYQQRYFREYYLSGKTCREIAEECGCTYQNVQAHIRKGLDKLHETYATSK